MPVKRRNPDREILSRGLAFAGELAEGALAQPTLAAAWSRPAGASHEKSSPLVPLSP